MWQQINIFGSMDLHFTPIEEKQLQLKKLEQEIIQLEQKMLAEQSATTLNDIRLRLRFLKWKKELLHIAYGK